MYRDNIQSLFQVAEIELVYRGKSSYRDRPVISSTWQAYDIMLDTWDMNKIELVEQVKILLLDRRFACLGISEIATGGINSCVADPKIIFAIALKAKACSLILAHNHPSGSLKPSPADIELTKKMVSGGKFLDIQVMDHLIITPQSYFSFAEKKLIS